MSVDTPTLEQLLAAHARERTERSWLAVLDTLFQHPDYAPYSHPLQEVAALVEEERLEQALEAWERARVNLCARPSARLMRAMILHKLGREHEEAREQTMLQALVEGIGKSGDGSLERPFKITSLEDEYFFLEAVLKQEPERRRAIHRKERSIDLWETRRGGVCFDISPLAAKLSTRLQGKSDGELKSIRRSFKTRKRRFRELEHRARKRAERARRKRMRRLPWLLLGGLLLTVAGVIAFFALR